MSHFVKAALVSSVSFLVVLFGCTFSVFSIALSGQRELATAIIFSNKLLFCLIAILICIGIGTSIAVHRALTRERTRDAVEAARAALVLVVVFAGVISVCIWLSVGGILNLFGVETPTLEIASEYLEIAIPSLPVTALGIGASGALLGAGIYKMSLYVYLALAVSLAADPLLIYGFSLESTSAMLATVLSRFICVVVGLCGIIRIHQLTKTSGNTS